MPAQVPRWLYPGHVGQHLWKGRPRAANHKLNGLREVGLALVTAGLVVLLFVAYELVGTNLAEEHSQARLARDFNAAVASVSLLADPGKTTPTTLSPTLARAAKGIATRLNWKAPARRSSPKAHNRSVLTEALPVTPPGGALDHLEIPAIGVNRYVVEGVAEADLQEGPGHYPGTPLPGQAGNVAIAGHRTTFGAPFFQLNEVHSGDLVYLTDALGTTWVYGVVSQFVVAPSDVAVLDATRTPELTLTTCNPRFEATSRLVVRAVLLTHLVRGTRVPKPLPVKATKNGRFPSVSGRSASLPSRPHTSHATTHVTSHGTTTGPGSALSVAPATTLRTSSTLPASVSSSATSSGGDSPTVGGGGDSPTVGPSPAGALLSASAGSTGTSSGTGGAGAGAVGWGAIALAGWAITRIAAARRRRYSKVAVLFAGALACLVPLWFAFGNAVNLLPANI
jgi:sortase A